VRLVEYKLKFLLENRKKNYSAYTPVGSIIGLTAFSFINEIFPRQNCIKRGGT
jgi:hypothetical protein